MIRTGRLILAPEIPVDLLSQVAQGEYLQLLRELGPVSSIVLPLQARGRTVGAISLATT